MKEEELRKRMEAAKCDWKKIYVPWGSGRLEDTLSGETQCILDAIHEDEELLKRIKSGELKVRKAIKPFAFGTEYGPLPLRVFANGELVAEMSDSQSFGEVWEEAKVITDKVWEILEERVKQKMKDLPKDEDFQVHQDQVDSFAGMISAIEVNLEKHRAGVWWEEIDLENPNVLKDEPGEEE